MKNSLRAAVIGTGEMGRHHVRIYAELDGVELVGVADTNKERADSIAEQYKTASYSDYTKLLSSDLDLVSVVVPTTLHKDISLHAMNQGINVLVEKPIADSLTASDLMITNAKENNVKLMVGHIERFNPAIIALKENQSKLGKIVSISARRVGPYNPRIRDVGIITDLAVHDIDVMSYLYSDNILTVHAYAGSVIHKFEDYASILVGFSNGKSGSVETNWLTPHKVRQLTVTGTEGIAYADYIEQTVELFTGDGCERLAINKGEPLRNELEHFVECIREDRDPLVGGVEGRHALEVALAAVRSYNVGRAVTIPDAKPDSASHAP